MDISLLSTEKLRKKCSAKQPSKDVSLIDQTSATAKRIHKHKYPHHSFNGKLCHHHLRHHCHHRQEKAKNIGKQLKVHSPSLLEVKSVKTTTITPDEQNQQTMVINNELSNNKDHDMDSSVDHDTKIQSSMASDDVSETSSQKKDQSLVIS